MRTNESKVLVNDKIGQFGSRRPAVQLLQMKLILLALALVPKAIPASVAQTQDGFAHPRARLYELYSWPESNDIWNFRLLPSPSGVNIPVETIFDEKFRIRGIDELKRKLSVLPTGTRIIWLPGLAPGQNPNKEGSKLALPSSHTVEKVKRYANQRGIRVEVPRSAPGRQDYRRSRFYLSSNPTFRDLAAGPLPSVRALRRFESECPEQQRGFVEQDELLSR